MRVAGFGLVLLACGTPEPQPVTARASSSASAVSPAPAETADAAPHETPLQGDAGAPASQVIAGEGSCKTDDDCVLGEAGFNCTSVSCVSRARSRVQQERWRRELVARCGPNTRDRYPCVPHALDEPTSSSRAICNEGRCATLQSDVR